jgi:hypothetical protein
MTVPATVAFRTGALAHPLGERVSPYASSVHRVAQRDLERYYTLLANARRRIPLSREELVCVLDALNGIHLRDATAALSIPLEVADYVRIARERDPLDRPDSELFHGVADPDAMVQRIAAMGVGELYALADLAERFWSQPELGIEWAAAQLGIT